MITLSYVTKIVLVTISWFSTSFNFVVMGVEG